MNFEEKILNQFDEYFKSAPKEEIEKDVAFINNIGFNGVTLEEYLGILNTATSYNLRDNGICDDIAFADLFNNSIRQIHMGNNDTIKIDAYVIKISPTIPCFVDKVLNHGIAA